MALPRVSSDSLSDQDRAEELRAFLERADDSLTGPIYRYGANGAPEDGLPMYMSMKVDKHGGISPTIKYPNMSDQQLLATITGLRPFLLSSSEVFLPRAARQMQWLVSSEFRDDATRLVQRVENWLAHKQEFHPQLMTLYRWNADGSDVRSAEAWQVAESWIYGKAVKSELPERKKFKQFQKDLGFGIKPAIISYLFQLMRVTNLVRSELRRLDAQNAFRCKIEGV